MTRQRLVELARDAVQLGQLRPRDGGEIVVLVVQADVVGEDVEGSVVGVCLWRRQGVERVRRGGCRFLRLFGLEVGEGLGAAGFRVREEVVLRDEVACAGVQGAGEEGAG